MFHASYRFLAWHEHGAWIMDYLGLMITNENCPCFVQCCKALTESASKGNKSLVSTIAIEKSLYKKRKSVFYGNG